MNTTICSIRLANVASYKDEVKLETDKPINLIYGLNGTGKTQISKFLANREDKAFKDCRVDGIGEEKILVYNQDFVEKNFYESNTQKGIFTLSEENAEIRERINGIQEEIRKLKTTNEGEKESLKNKKEEVEKCAKEFGEKVWKIKSDQKMFGDFFKGKKGDKKVFREFIRKQYEAYKMPSDSKSIEQKIDIKELERQYRVLTDATQEKLIDINELSFEKFVAIEDNAIFDESIVGSQESIIANLIEKLENGDWVKAGFNVYVRDDSDICPFCQQNTITQDFRNHLKKYFNETYEAKVKTIADLKRQYESLSRIPSIETFYRRDILSDSDLEFRELYSKVKSNLEGNIRRIEEKIKEPSRKIKLENSKTLFEKLNEYINNIQAKIKEFNALLADKKKEKDRLEETFWRHICSKYQSTIDKHIAIEKKLQNEQDQIQKSINKIEAEIKEKEGEIQTKQKDIVNIAESVESIGRELQGLGMVNFRIKIDDEKEQSYIIVREGENEPSFKTLSEGEKTLISFLYFLQLCRGKETKDEANSKKIVVIDDPISSLSFNYVYDVACLIKRIFFFKEREFEKIFILTHHLYFFNELKKPLKKSKCLG